MTHIEQLQSHRLVTLETDAEVRAQICEDFRSAFQLRESRLRPTAPPTYRELSEHMHRAMHPTPAETAAQILNLRVRGITDDMPRLAVSSWMGWMSGTPAWLELRRAVRRVKREAPTYLRFR